MNKLDEKKIKNLNEKFLSKKDFGLQQVLTRMRRYFLFKNSFREIKKKFKDIITIIAPRHIDRVNEIKIVI